MSSCFFTWLCFFLFACTCIAPASSSNSSASESSSTISARELYSTLSFFTSYYTGGERLYGRDPLDTRYYSFTKKYARFQIQNHRRTNDTGVYEVKGYLFIQFPYWYAGGSDHNDGRSGGARQTQGTVRFWLKGLWSERSRHLMMIGSATWLVEGNPIILDVVLDLHYTVKNDPTLYTGYISGTLKSLVSEDVLGYFDPFSIFSFPALPNYNYSLLSQVFGDTISSNSDAPEKQWLSHEGYKYCWVIKGESLLLEVEYAAECREKHQHCYPLGTGDELIESLPRFLLLTPIQCSAAARKLRYMATFQYTRYDDGFGLNSTVIGEASWDDTKKELSGIACRLLDPLNRSANEEGDCTMRLSLRYTSIFSIRTNSKIVGRFRSTTHVEKSGYFRKINFTNADKYGLMTPTDVRYEYTELDRARRSCIAKKKPVKKGNTYPDVHSQNMGLDMSVENSRGEEFAWASATPLWIGNDLYRKENMISVVEMAETSETHSTNTSHSNISYLISLNSSPELKFGYLFESLNWSTNGHNEEVEIAAEGVYNAETGYLCMVGCRKLDSSTDISRDSEILVTLEFAPLTGKRSGRTEGTIRSMRAKTDPLYFDDLIIYSAYYYAQDAAHSLWRMDLEIAIVFISNTLASIFVALQIRHVKRNPEVPSSVSLLMLLILSVGNMLPLVLNFEVAYLRRHPVEQSEYIGYGGSIDANEVAVRLSSLVAFLLQIRLLQLVFTAKQRDGNGNSLWTGEKKVGFVSLALYVSGVLLAWLLNWTSMKHVNQVQTKIRRGWRSKKHVNQVQTNIFHGGVMSYAGLFLDGFLLPQVLLNAFRGSGVKALSHPFYMGISALRLAPHAYSQYRAHNYPVTALDRTYYYANPTAGFYSTAWDIMIPFGILTLAVILFLQQRRGGRRLTFFLKV